MRRDPLQGYDHEVATGLAEGTTAPDGDLLGMGFYVEGIGGEIPK